MKHLITLLLWLALALDATATVVKVNSRNFTSEPTQKRRVTMTLTTAGPVVQSPWLIAGDSVAQTTDTNGICYFSNAIAGIYRLDIAGSPGRSFPMALADATNYAAVVDAANLINSTNSGPYFYTSTQVDALIGTQIGGTATNVHLQTSGGLLTTTTNAVGNWTVDLTTNTIAAIAGTAGALTNNETRSVALLNSLLTVGPGTGSNVVLLNGDQGYVGSGQAGFVFQDTAGTITVPGGVEFSGTNIWDATLGTNKIDSTFYDWVMDQSSSGISASTASNIVNAKFASVAPLTNTDTRAVTFYGSPFSIGSGTGSNVINLNGDNGFIGVQNTGLVINDPNSTITVPAGISLIADGSALYSLDGANITAGSVPHSKLTVAPLTNNETRVVRFTSFMAAPTNYTDRVEATNSSTLTLYGGGVEAALESGAFKVRSPYYFQGIATGLTQIPGSGITAGSISNAQIADATITSNKLAFAIGSGGTTYSNLTETGYTLNVQSNLNIGYGLRGGSGVAGMLRWGTNNGTMMVGGYNTIYDNAGYGAYFHNAVQFNDTIYPTTISWGSSYGSITAPVLNTLHFNKNINVGTNVSAGGSITATGGLATAISTNLFFVPSNAPTAGQVIAAVGTAGHTAWSNAASSSSYSNITQGATGVVIDGSSNWVASLFTDIFTTSALNVENLYPTNLYTGLTNATALATDANGKIVAGSGGSGSDAWTNTIPIVHSVVFTNATVPASGDMVLFVDNSKIQLNNTNILIEATEPNATITLNAASVILPDAVQMTGAGLSTLAVGAAASGGTNHFEVIDVSGNKIVATSTNGTTYLANLSVAGNSTVASNVTVTGSVIGNGGGLTNILQSSIVATTNAATGLNLIPNLTVPYSKWVTNDTFSVELPTGGVATNVQTAVILVINTGATYEAITPPAGGVKYQGTWAVTNASSITVWKYGNDLTNMICLPLY